MWERINRLELDLRAKDIEIEHLQGQLDRAIETAIHLEAELAHRGPQT